MRKYHRGESMPYIVSKCGVLFQAIKRKNELHFIPFYCCLQPVHLHLMGSPVVVVSFVFIFGSYDQQPSPLITQSELTRLRLISSSYYTCIFVLLSLTFFLMVTSLLIPPPPPPPPPAQPFSFLVFVLPYGHPFSCPSCLHLL